MRGAPAEVSAREREERGAPAEAAARDREGRDMPKSEGRREEDETKQGGGVHVVNLSLKKILVGGVHEVN